MLTYTDLELLFRHRNEPGRLRLVDSTSKQFVSTTQTEAAGVMTHTLPAPAQGFFRFWLALHGVISTAVATDVVLLRWGAGAAIPTVLMRLFPNNVAALLIGGGSGQNVAAGPTYKAIDPILVGQDDFIEVVYQVTAASGQTSSLIGRYMDFPG